MKNGCILALMLALLFASAPEMSSAKEPETTEAPRQEIAAPVPEGSPESAYVGPLPYIPVEIPEAELPEPEPEPEPEPVMTYLGSYWITGYDICLQCCGKLDGITASGAAATVGRTCAVNNLPFGTVLYIDGIGERVVEDRGGMVGNVVDVLCADHSACYAITGQYDVYIVEAQT